MVCVHSQSALLRLQVALQANCLKQALGCLHFPGLSHSGSGSRVLHKGTDLAGPEFCALPRSGQLRRPGTWQGHSPQVGSASYHLPGPSCLVSWVHSGSTVSQHSGCHVSPLGSWSLAATLLVDVNCPGTQEDLVNNSEAAHSLVEDAGSGAEIAPCLLTLAAPRLPLCLWLGMGGLQLASSPLVFAQSFVLWVAWQCLRLELFAGKLSLSFFLSLAIPQFGLLSHISSLRLSSGHSGPVLTLSNADCTSLFSPDLLVADTSIMATSLLGVAVRYVICGFCFFFLLVMLPSEIPKLPTDPPVRGFPGVWKLLLLHNSLPGMDLCP